MYWICKDTRSLKLCTAVDVAKGQWSDVRVACREQEDNSLLKDTDRNISIYFHVKSLWVLSALKNTEMLALSCMLSLCKANQLSGDQVLSSSSKFEESSIE